MPTLDLSSKLAEFTVGFQLDAVPTKALENAKIAILDCLGVAVLATRQEIGNNSVEFRAQQRRHWSLHNLGHSIENHAARCGAYQRNTRPWPRLRRSKSFVNLYPRGIVCRC